MNIVLLSPYFPPNYYNFVVALSRLGVNALTIGDASYDGFRHELRDALTEYYRVDDMHNYDHLLRACGYFTHRYGKLARLESHNEYWLETDARLRTDFNIPGPKVADMDKFKRKSRMKQVFADAGIGVARGQIVRRASLTDANVGAANEEALAFIDEVGYPVIAKPDVGVGAAATYKIHNAAELADFFAQQHAVDYLLEAFIAGDLYSFDGLTDRDGNIVFYTSHYFSQGIMETVNEGLDMYYYSLREIPEGLKEVGFKTVAAFDIRERFFHIEFFKVGRAAVGDLAQRGGAAGAVGDLAQRGGSRAAVGDLAQRGGAAGAVGDLAQRGEAGAAVSDQGAHWVALELNMRPPGGLTMDMFNYANDIDLYQQWANVVVSNSFTAKYTRRYHCGYAGRKQQRNYRLSHDEVLQKYDKFISHHEAISGIMAPAIGDYGYVVRARDLSVLLDVVQGILAPAQGG
jgi:hypothetical protein